MIYKVSLLEIIYMTHFQGFFYVVTLVNESIILYRWQTWVNFSTVKTVEKRCGLIYLPLSSVYSRNIILRPDAIVATKKSRVREKRREKLRRKKEGSRIMNDIRDNAFRSWWLAITNNDGCRIVMRSIDQPDGAYAIAIIKLSDYDVSRRDILYFTRGSKENLWSRWGSN